MLNKKTFRTYIQARQFDRLFISELGWAMPSVKAPLMPIDIDGTIYQPRPVASLAEYRVLVCDVDDIPPTAVCRKLDLRIRKSTSEYLCIFVMRSSELHHLWMTPVRKVDKRDLVLSEYANAAQSDAIFAKLDGISFSLNESPTISDVRERINASFVVNSEKITKEFYAGFKKEHSAFASFISGIDDDSGEKNNRTRQWYASVMLNRLMFCYFIQKKGFLDNNVNYLREKLEWSKQELGHNTFFKGFYRSFLKRLFHDGLNAPQHNDEFEAVYGRVPYLNGGMFDEHPIEHQYANIDVADEAFDRLFTFFDKWNWHLDTRITASGKDINPDVLGYIFEQYINDRAQMGAYYTKEDITEYIGRNCIVPYLFDAVSKASAEAAQDFEPEGYVWQTLRASGDRYLFDAVKQGYSADWRNRIPHNIEAGIDTTQPGLLERRKDWNNPTEGEFGLPTEIWRESIERLQRCDDILGKIERGEITSINDFITYNLDIRQFAHDLLTETNDHRFVLHFYHALQRVTILDPTCGSGAFLFAALNILEPLYEVCIDRMEEFNKQNSNLFVAELAEIAHRYRSNIQYFIYKSIILRNLYGVDIMVEATEVAKLRLFLKMVAVVDVDRSVPNLGLDPLPDIDFNIRCGNTLVGYATEEELNRDLNSDTDLLQMIANQEFKATIDEEMAKVATAYEVFKSVQLNQAEDMATFKQAKHELAMRLASLNEKLNKRLYLAYNAKSYEEWLSTHQPFHWLAEFYQIIHGNGGFDVIVGNPPYVGYTRKNKDTGKAVIDYYQVSKYYITLPTSNLYAFVIERSKAICNKRSKFGVIIPISAFANNSMSELQRFIKSEFGMSWISNYHQRPAQLFEGVLQRLSIIISYVSERPRILTTGIYRWYADTRTLLFKQLQYVELSQNKQPHIAKVGTKLEVSIFEKYIGNRETVNYIAPKPSSVNNVYYRTAGGGYWVTFLNESFDCDAVSNKRTSICENYNSKVFSAAYNSNLFWWYYSINYDLFNFKDYMIFGFRLSYDVQIEQKLMALSDKMECSLRSGAIHYTINSKTRGANTTVTYQKSLSKSIMDEIDKVLAEHYGFTEEELDFIINYDIKYRMGDELNTEE